MGSEWKLNVLAINLFTNIKNKSKQFTANLNHSEYWTTQSQKCLVRQSTPEDGWFNWLYELGCPHYKRRISQNLSLKLNTQARVFFRFINFKSQTRYNSFRNARIKKANKLSSLKDLAQSLDLSSNLLELHHLQTDYKTRTRTMHFAQKKTKQGTTSNLAGVLLGSYVLI